MILRQFNDDGIKRFRKEIDKCRKDPQSKIDFQLLEDDTLTEIIPGAVDVEHKGFETKGEAGQYLHSILDSTPVQNIMSNVGLWSWLSLYFFDSVCPLKPQGRKVKSDYFYIYEPGFRRFYRHLLFVSWRVFDIAPKHHRLVTTTLIGKGDSITDEIIKRLSRIRIPCMFEVLDRVYWDETTQKLRKHAGSWGRRGNLRRFLRVIEHLEKTYDLQILDATQFINLLGDEFDFSSR